MKSVGVNSEFVGVVGRCGRWTRIESFICVFFSVGGTGAAGDGDSSGLLCFLLFFLAFGGLGLRFRSLDSIPFGRWVGDCRFQLRKSEPVNPFGRALIGIGQLR